MQILVINPGSSSIKFSIVKASSKGAPLESEAEGELSGIGGASAALELRTAQGEDLAGCVGEVRATTMQEAIALVERAIEVAGTPSPDAVGYRVVHPGPKLKGHRRIDPEVLAELKRAKEFAPLHDPVAVEMIEEMMRRLPNAQHFACFDTVFHETMPEVATTYALPEEVRAEGVRRYGFHGLSCESVVRELDEAMHGAAPRRLVIAHLGSGSSVTATSAGHSIDTTMGLTPTGGVVMGTRPGDLDPGVILYLLRRAGATIASVEQMLNHDAGLKALGGVNDMRELRRRESAGDAAAKLAICIFVHSVARAVAGMIGLYGCDAVVFTGGIGEHDGATRSEVCALLGRMGLRADEKANQDGLGGASYKSIGLADSAVAVLIAKADEDRMIAQHVAAMCSWSHPG